MVGTQRKIYLVQYSCSEIPDSCLIYTVVVFFSFILSDVNSTKTGKNSGSAAVSKHLGSAFNLEFGILALHSANLTAQTLVVIVVPRHRSRFFFFEGREVGV